MEEHIKNKIIKQINDYKNSSDEHEKYYLYGYALGYIAALSSAEKITNKEESEFKKTILY